LLKRRKLIRFGDSILMDRGFYAYRNYLIGIMHGIVPLIIPKKNFRFERLEGLVNYPLFIFNSKNVEKEKRRYKKLVWCSINPQPSLHSDNSILKTNS